MTNKAPRGTIFWLLLLCAAAAVTFFMLPRGAANRKAGGRHASRHPLISHAERAPIRYFRRGARRPLTHSGPHESLPMPSAYRDRG
jgi:hypothetical protein